MGVMVPAAEILAKAKEENVDIIGLIWLNYTFSWKKCLM